MASAGSLSPSCSRSCRRRCRLAWCRSTSRSQPPAEQTVKGRGPERRRHPRLRGPEPAGAVVALVRAGSATVGEAMDNHGQKQSPRIEETAAQPSCSFPTSGDARGRSGVRVSPPGCREPPGSWQRGAGHRAWASPSGQLEPLSPGGSIVGLAARATRVPQAAVTSGIQRTTTVTQRRPLAWPHAADLGDLPAEKLHGMQVVKHPSKPTTHRPKPRDAAFGEGDGAIPG
jgi:hypothetical protein